MHGAVGAASGVLELGGGLPQGAELRGSSEMLPSVPGARVLLKTGVR